MTPARMAARAAGPLPYAAPMTTAESKERAAAGGGRAAGGQGVRGVGRRPRPGPPGGAGARRARRRPRAGRPAPVDARRRPGRGRGVGARAIAVPTNIIDAEACARLMAAASEEFGGVDVLVNNAFRPDVFQSFEDVDLDRVAQDHGRQRLRVAADDPGCAALHADAWRRVVVMVASMVARQPQPGAGWLRHLERSAPHGHAGAGRRARPFQGPGQRRGPRLDGRAPRWTSTSR